MNSIAQAVPEAALQAIRKLIKEQGFGPGDALPSQRDLALQLGVSRASLREALSSLSALGVVNVQPGKGVFVQDVQEAPGFAWPFAAQATPPHALGRRGHHPPICRAALAGGGTTRFAGLYPRVYQ